MTPAGTTRLLTLAAIWGGSYLFMRVAAPEIGARRGAVVGPSLAAVGQFGGHARQLRLARGGARGLRLQQAHPLAAPDQKDGERHGQQRRAVGL